jgi:hypothetical protein
VIIDPPLRWVSIGMTTTVDIRILNVADLYGAEAHISYNPAIVQVVDQDPGVSGVQIAVDGFPYGDYVALNRADNGIGYLELALTQLIPRPSVNGSGTLATITFLAVGWGISPVDIITATLADPRGVEILSTWVDGVIQVGGTITPSPTPTQTPTTTTTTTTTTTVTPTPTGSMTPTPTVTIDPNAQGSLRGRVLFQGRPTPPHWRWSSPLTVTVHLNPSSAPLYTFGTICDTSGYFTVTGITTGTYSVKVHDWHSLKNRRDNLYIDAGLATGEFGTLLEGDMDLNDVINILDYSILTQGYNKTPAQPGWDPRTDLDNSLEVDILDYSLLVTNYGRSGETVVAGGNPFAKDTDPPKPAALAVPLRLRPASPAP